MAEALGTGAGRTAAPVDASVWGARASGIGGIEHELARLRRSRGAHSRELGVPVARASVLNLVVFATREAHARRAARTIADLAIRHPSRAAVILADRERGSGGGELDLYCRLAGSAPAEAVSYEQVLIRARGDADARLASAVIPLLLPDLPVFLWWTGTPPLQAPHFDALLARADRLIVDSADFARPDRTLPEIAAVARNGHGRYGVTDFNWTRLTPWRDLVAQFFDVPAWRPFLDGITGVRVGFAVDADGREIHPSQALLFAGWLASRLGWRAVERLAPSEAGGLLFAMARGEVGADPAAELVRMRVRPRFERGMEEGDLSGLRLQAAAGGRQAEFVIKRIGETHAGTSVVIDGATVASRIVALRRPEVSDLLGEELTIARSDSIYEGALAALVALA
ncbi:MAG TPA: glucose-6-phosphate dehydrogenase assembly protein OpcA [Candidatus Saccharimonadales bacterium]|nr:glucose-6-phosphate dehydrogenase assembly protein OpcA [Candidatus Saccharimonadales bacterium]